MSRLTLSILGSPHFKHGDQVLDLPTRKAAALLVYLLVEGGVHSREKLAAIFWPEKDSKRGRTNLRNTLVQLRLHLDHDHGDAHLRVTRSTLGFNFASDFESDWHLLQNIVEAEQVSRLQTIVEQYRGDFLEGFSLGDAPEFDDWSRLRREQAHRQMETVFDRLSELYRSAGQTVTAMRVANRWLLHNPLNEAAYRRLMRLHLAQGDRSGIRSVYEQCRAALRRELGTEPSPKTEALLERIRSHPLPTSGTGHLPTARHPEMPLVGRSREHRLLAATFRAATGAATRVAGLEGGAGAGKTHLASHFLKWAAAEGADVLSGRAFEAGGRVPYHSLVQALRTRMEEENAPEDLLSDNWLTELSWLLPELRDRYPDLPVPPGDGIAARTRLFESIVRFVQSLAQRKPVVLFLDDVHWIDVATLDCLQYAVNRWLAEGVPVMVLLCWRSETLAFSSRLAPISVLSGWLSNLDQSGTLTRIALSPFTAADTAELIKALSGEVGPVASSFSDWLYTETGGQPFYISEMLKTLLEKKWLRSEQGPDGGQRLDLSPALSERGSIRPELRGLLPAGVHKVVRARLSGLSPNAFLLAAAASVLGKDLNFDHLCGVSGQEEMAVLSGLDELLSLRLIVESGSPRQPYSFAHDKIRDIVYTEAGDARRLLLHRRAETVLQEAHAPVAELAHHALHAGHKEAAIRHSVAAGDDALALFAVRDAIVYYGQARQLLRDESGIEMGHSLWQRLYLQLGRVHEILGGWERAANIYQELQSYAREHGLAEAECLALNRLALVRAFQHQLEDAQVILERALPLAERSGDLQVLAETHWNFGQLAMYHGIVADSQLHGKKALELAHQLDEPELIARCLNLLAYDARNRGNAAAGISVAEEALDRYRSLGDRALEADCLGVLSQLCLLAGEATAAVDYAGEALTISRKIESAHGLRFNGYQLVVGLLEQAAYEKAAAVLQQVETDVGAEAPAFDRAMLKLLEGFLYRARGDAEAALTADQAGLDITARHASAMLFPMDSIFAATLAEDFALLGAWKKAAAHAREAPSIEASPWLVALIAVRWWLVSEALLREGARESAEALGQQLEQISRDAPRFRLPSARVQSLLAAWDVQA